MFFALLMVVAVLTIVISVISLNRDDRLSDDIIRANETNGDIERMIVMVRKAETGRRAYLSTRAPYFRRVYDSAVGQISLVRDHLAATAVGDAEQDEDLKQLQAAVQAKLDELATPLAAGDKLAPGRIGAIDPAAMTNLHLKAEQFASHQQAKLAARRTAEAQFRNRCDTALFTIMLATAGIMAVTLWRDDRQRIAQAALLVHVREVAARQKAIFDGALDAIITLDPKGTAETVNAAGLRLLGYGEAEIVGRDIGLLFDLTPEMRAMFSSPSRQAQDPSNGLAREILAKPKTGAAIPVDVVLSDMVLADGVHKIAIVRDISERRRVEVMKDHFIATVSHELRTPLTSITGSLGLLRGGAGGPLPPRAARLVEIAEANGARLVRLINDILDIEKIMSGSAVFDTRPLRVSELAQGARDAMAGFAAERSVALTVDRIDPDLWITGDQDRMMQVMLNLLSNAIKVSPAGRAVRIAAQAFATHGRVMIIDQGPGVPADFREKIFERFAQADGSDGRQLEGTGLGLSIVRELVERQGGSVGFESRPGAGATFFFDLRLATAPVATQTHVPVTVARPRLLICEDDELIAEVLIDQLASFGYAADSVSTANEARHALHTGGYNALILDVRLPDSDGLTLMQALRASPHTAHLPIIMMSGAPTHRARARAMGIIDWLDKPIDMERLRLAVKAALKAREAAAPLILHVDDDHDIVEIARGRLGGLGEIVSANTLAAARTLLADRRPDLVILDVGLPDGSGKALLDDLRHLPGGGPPTILYTAQDADCGADPLVAAVLVKSRSDMTNLARVARRVIQRGAA